MSCSSNRNRVVMSRYKLRAAKMYSSGEIEYFLFFPPTICWVSTTRYWQTGRERGEGFRKTSLGNAVFPRR